MRESLLTVEDHLESSEGDGRVTSTQSALRLAIAAPAAVVVFYVLVTLGLLVAYPPWLTAEVALGIPAASLVLAGSLFLAATSKSDHS
jgi:hypothetical protein